MDKYDAAKGVGLSLVGSAVKSANAILVRFAGKNGFDAFELILARSLFQVVLFGYLVKAVKKPFIPPKGTRLACFFVAVLNTACGLCNYQAYNMIMPGLAISSNRAARTLFTMVMTCICTADSLIVLDYVSAFFCMTGMGFAFAYAVIFPSNDFVPSSVIGSMQDDPVLISVTGTVLITFAALLKSISMILIRRNKDKLHSFALIFYQAIVGSPTMAVLVLRLSDVQWPPSWTGLGFTVAICITSSIVTWAANRSVQLAPAAIVALVQNIDIVLGFAMDTIFFTHTWPAALQVAAGSFIMLGVLIIASNKVHRYRKSRKLKVAEAADSEITLPIAELQPSAQNHS